MGITDYLWSRVNKYRSSDFATTVSIRSIVCTDRTLDCPDRTKNTGLRDRRQTSISLHSPFVANSTKKREWLDGTYKLQQCSFTCLLSVPCFRWVFTGLWKTWTNFLLVLRLVLHCIRPVGCCHHNLATCPFAVSCIKFLSLVVCVYVETTNLLRLSL